MALTGIQIFKLTPKTNCRDCGCPTCMAFSMKAAQGKAELSGCPHLTDEAREKLLGASAPPMASVKCSSPDAELMLGGETVLFRHDKTFVNETRYAVTIDTEMSDAEVDRILKSAAAVDYERIGERMYVEMIEVRDAGEDNLRGINAEGSNAGETDVPELSLRKGENADSSDPAILAVSSRRDRYLSLVRKAAATGRVLILTTKDPAAAQEAAEICAPGKPVLNAADGENYAVMAEIAKKYDLTLGVTGGNLNEIRSAIEETEKTGYKNLIISVPSHSLREAFAMTVLIRRAALLDGDRTFGYPTFVDAGALAGGDTYLESAVGALFTSKYGSVIAFRKMNYATALPLFGLRQNLFTDPQKPMTVKPGIYPLNGADENSICVVTVDFALTYFVVSGEIERSKVPCNLCITDAAGQSVLTAWASGKLSADSIASFVKNEVAPKIKCRRLAIPGKVTSLKGELMRKLPEWEILSSSNEAVGIVPFLKSL